MHRQVGRVLQSLVAVVAVGSAAARFVAIDATSHSASDTLRPWFIQAALIVAVASALLVAIEWLLIRDRQG